MVIKRSLAVILALLLAMGSLAAGAQRPDHGGGRTALPDGTATPTVGFDCRNVESYAEDLNLVLEDDGAFFDLVFSGTEFEEVPAEDAEAIIMNGDEVIEALNTLDTPAPYQPAHDGIILFFQTIIDFTMFYTVDSSSVPDVLGFDLAMTGIYQGESALAEACPDEVDDLGGFLFMNPATLEDEFAPEE